VDVLIAIFPNLAVDADHLAGEVEQRPAGVAAHQHAVGVQAVGGLFDDFAHAEHGAARFVKTARMPEREAPLARLRLDDLAAQFHEGPGLFALLELCQRGVGRFVQTEGFRGGDAAVLQNDPHVLARTARNVRGGEQQAISRNDHATGRAAAGLDGDERRTHLRQQLLHVSLNAQQRDKVGFGRFLRVRTLLLTTHLPSEQDRDEDESE
jgi:hypothetical protein